MWDQPPLHPSRDFRWLFWPVVPIYPYGQRRTLRTEVVKDTIWTFDQIQGIVYVVVPIRMTVVKLEAGGLLVYAPIAPTPECLRLVRELVAEHGDIRYIILPTVSGVEHKVFVGPFAREFPQAQVYLAPDQWSYPINLPLSWLGIPPERTHRLTADSHATPFADEFDYACLGPIDLKQGPFEEVVFYHKRSHTLLVTDTVLAVPEDPPAVVQLDPYPLLFHARDHVFDVVSDSAETRRRGWQRICLFSFYFRPSVLEIVKTLPSIRDALKAPNHSRKAYFGWYPFRWQADWQSAFKALRGDGRLFVAPILQQLILNRAPQETLSWVEQVASWPFQRIIPCHLQAPLNATPQEFRRAFDFLRPYSAVSGSATLLPAADLAFLKELDQGLSQAGIVPPPQH